MFKYISGLLGKMKNGQQFIKSVLEVKVTNLKIHLLKLIGLVSVAIETEWWAGRRDWRSGSEAGATRRRARYVGESGPHAQAV